MKNETGTPPWSRPRNVREALSPGSSASWMCRAMPSSSARFRTGHGPAAGRYSDGMPSGTAGRRWRSTAAVPELPGVQVEVFAHPVGDEDGHRPGVLQEGDLFGDLRGDQNRNRSRDAGRCRRHERGHLRVAAEDAAHQAHELSRDSQPLAEHRPQGTVRVGQADRGGGSAHPTRPSAAAARSARPARSAPGSRLPPPPADHCGHRARRCARMTTCWSCTSTFGSGRVGSGTESVPQTSFEFATAGRVLVGAGRAAELAPTAARLGSRALICTGSDPHRHAELVATLTVPYATFGVRGEPTVEMARQAAAAARQHGADLVVGIGGGSVIDLAKSVAMLLANGGDPLDYLEGVGRGRVITQPAAPCVAVPTTAGTGAEVTANAVLAAPRDRLKAS